MCGGEDWWERDALPILCVHRVKCPLMVGTAVDTGPPREKHPHSENIIRMHYSFPLQRERELWLTYNALTPQCIALLCLSLPWAPVHVGQLHHPPPSPVPPPPLRLPSSNPPLIHQWKSLASRPTLFENCSPLTVRFSMLPR